jgi:hypothetical protein
MRCFAPHSFIAKKELASTNQNPKIELRREAPQLNFWVLYQI